MLLDSVSPLYKIDTKLTTILVCNVGKFEDWKIWTTVFGLTGFLKTVGSFQVDFYSQTSSRVASFSATEDPVRLGTCEASARE